MNESIVTKVGSKLSSSQQWQYSTRQFHISRPKQSSVIFSKFVWEIDTKSSIIGIGVNSVAQATSYVRIIIRKQRSQDIFLRGSHASLCPLLVEKEELKKAVKCIIFSRDVTKSKG
jgi:hypothetical protein